MSGTSKNPDNAKKLLHAMTNVEDRYIQEAMAFAEGADNKEDAGTVDRKKRAKTLRFQRNVGVIVALAACLALVFVSARVTGVFQPKGRGTASSAPAADAEEEAAPAAEEFAASAGDNSSSGTATGNAADAQNDLSEGDATQDSETESADAGYAAGGNPYQEVSSLAEAESITGFSMEVPTVEETGMQETVAVIDGSMIEVAYSSTEAGGSDTSSGQNAAAEQSMEEKADSTEENAVDVATDSENAADGDTNSEARAESAADAGTDDTSDTEAASLEDAGTTETYYIRKATQTGTTAQDISGDYNTYPDVITLTQNGITITLKGDKTKDAWSVATWSADGFDYAIGAQEAPMTQEQILSIAGEVK